MFRSIRAGSQTVINDLFIPVFQKISYFPEPDTVNIVSSILLSVMNRHNIADRKGMSSEILVSFKVELLIYAL